MIRLNLSIAMYAFPRARLGAMRSNLISSDDFNALIDADNLEDILSLLKISSYGDEMSRLSSTNPLEIENVLRRSLLIDYKKLSVSLYGFGKIFINRVSKKFEVQVLKSAIGEKVSGSEAQISEVTPFGSIEESLIERIRRSESHEELAEVLRPTEYYPIFQNALSEVKDNGNPFTLVSGIDKYVYDRISEKLKAVHGLDKRISRLLIGTEIDFKNIMLALRCREMEDEDVEKLFINYRYMIDDISLKTLKSEGPEAFTQENFPYSQVVGNSVDSYKKDMSLLPIETALENHLMHLNIIALTGFPFQLGAVIAYLNMKENEIKNLIIILRGKKEGLEREDIENLLIFPSNNR